MDAVVLATLIEAAKSGRIPVNVATRVTTGGQTSARIGSPGDGRCAGLIVTVWPPQVTVAAAAAVIGYAGFRNPWSSVRTSTTRWPSCFDGLRIQISGSDTVIAAAHRVRLLSG